jgi:hypothetical protein
VHPLGFLPLPVKGPLLSIHCLCVNHPLVGHVGSGTHPGVVHQVKTPGCADCKLESVAVALLVTLNLLADSEPVGFVYIVHLHPTPGVPGHEGVGRVQAVGDKVGQPLIYPASPCQKQHLF